MASRPPRGASLPRAGKTSRRKTPKGAPARRPSVPRKRKAGLRAADLGAAGDRRPGVVVGVGLSTVDFLCVAPHHNDRIAELSVFSMQGGGTMGNAIATVASLGAPSRYFWRLGDDDFGRYILRGLEEFDVDCSAVSVEPGMISPLSIVQIDELSRRRKIMTAKGNTSPMSHKDLPRRLLDQAGLLIIDGFQPAPQAALAEKARENGIPVLLNAGHLHGGMGELITLADYVIGSERFATEIAPSDRIERSLSEIARLGPRCVVITLGDSGSIALEGETLVQQDAIDVFIADTTGAGDVFCGAFAYAIMQNWRIEKALPFANAAAGLCCRAIGARAGIPSLDDVIEAAAGD